MIHFALTGYKRRILDTYLARWGRDVSDFMRPVTYEELAGLDAVPRGTWVLSDIDALGPGATELATALHDALTGAGQRVLNDPGGVLDRPALLQALHERGVNDFRAVSARDDAWRTLRYPVFVRGARDHLGSLAPPVGTEAAVEEVLRRAVATGHALDDLIVVEFEDTSDPGGLFRKHGTYVVGDRIVPQHVMWSHRWMIKHKHSIFTAENAREEYDLVTSNPHEDAVRECFDIAGVDYGRMDYSVGRDGRIQVWEINLCPIICATGTPAGDRIPEELREIRQERVDWFYARFGEAWEAVDAPGEGPDVPFDAPATVREAALADLAPPRGPGALMHLLRTKSHFEYW